MSVPAVKRTIIFSLCLLLLLATVLSLALGRYPFPSLMLSVPCCARLPAGLSLLTRS